MTDKIFITAIILLAIVLFVLTLVGGKKTKVVKELKKSPSKPINTVLENEYVRLHGKVEALSKPMIAPISGRPCVYYHITIDEEYKNGFSRIIDDFEYQDFYLRSGTDKALISAHNRNATLLYLEFDHKRNTNWMTDASGRMEAYLLSRGETSKAETGLFTTTKRMRFKEAILEPEEKIVVKGKANWLKDHLTPDGKKYPRRLELSGDFKKKLLVTDLPEALRILPKTRK